MKGRLWARCCALAGLFCSGAAFAGTGAALNFDPLPHTFNDIDTFDDWSTPNHVGEMNLSPGRTWYRKSFTLRES